MVPLRVLGLIAWILIIHYYFTSASSSTNHSELLEWVERYDRDAGRIYYESQEAHWAYSTNLTACNLQILQEKVKNLDIFKKNKYEEAMKLDWQNVTDQFIIRLFSKITHQKGGNLPLNISKRLTQLISGMKRIYGVASVCNKSRESSGKCYPLDPDLTLVMAKSEDPEELLWAWKGWRDETGRNMRDMFEEYVSILNTGAKLTGFQDNGAAWRAPYESPTFVEDCESLWQEIKPFYEHLHAYARRRLMQRYPEVTFPSEGHIPAHLLGNMWAQTWENIEAILRPSPQSTGMDVTSELVKQNYTPLEMFQLAEKFFTSLGFEPMPSSFWQKSMMVKPSDRDVICHASAHDFYNGKDFRIKQCTEVTMKWFLTIHHEMGHIQYYLHYKNQPIPFRDGANPGFHEAIGDVASLSISTPDHLQSLGLLPDFVDDASGDLNFLMQQALTKVAFIPFGYLIDQWRWDVFNGKTDKNDYNKHWWDARCKYQGLSPPVERSEGDFDAGSKFHVPSGVPYLRYFVAHVIQFQIHEALCNEANNTRPLHRCDITNSTEAGNTFSRLMRAGSSRPWPEVLKELTGTDKMSANSLLKYYRPLIDWLKGQNEGHLIGWSEDCPSGSFRSDDIHQK